MGISIRDPKVGELARELASLRKTNMTEAIAHALRSELKRERDKRPLVERLEQLADETVADGRTQSAGSHEGRDRRPLGPVIFIDTSVFVAILLERAGSCATSSMRLRTPKRQRDVAALCAWKPASCWSRRLDISPRDAEDEFERLPW